MGTDVGVMVENVREVGDETNPAMAVWEALGRSNKVEGDCVPQAEKTKISTTRVNATTSFDWFFIISCILSVTALAC